MHADKQKILRLLKTSKGQIEGLIKMVEEQRGCIEISNQLLAASSVLKRINLDILQGHFKHCIKEIFESGSEKQKEKKLIEVNKVLEKILK